VIVVALPFGDDISSAGGKADIERERENGRVDITREVISIEKHLEVYQFYSSFLRIMK
jgi:hypothetical protein